MLGLRQAYDHRDQQFQTHLKAIQLDSSQHVEHSVDNITSRF